MARKRAQAALGLVAVLAHALSGQRWEATAGVVGIGVALGAILVGQDVAGDGDRARRVGGQRALGRGPVVVASAVSCVGPGAEDEIRCGVEPACRIR
jgi:hypothetical protein